MSGATFELLDHPADVGFRAFGGTVAKLFQNAALALVSIAGDIDNVEARCGYPLEAAGTDYESLLVAWLSEVLYWIDGKRITFCRFRITEIGPARLTATGWGEPCDPIRHRTKVIVKAVTWHQLRVAEAAQGWVAEVYLDI